MAVLIAYASKHSSTQEIAERIAAKLRLQGCEAEVRPVGEVANVKSYSGIVVGSAVYFGRWLAEATDFVPETARLCPLCPSGCSAAARWATLRRENRPRTRSYGSPSRRETIGPSVAGSIGGN
jgi:menaquinone-dependent protoporphyrinogen IX oxidase